MLQLQIDFSFFWKSAYFFYFYWKLLFGENEVNGTNTNNAFTFSVSPGPCGSVLGRLFFLLFLNYMKGFF